MKLFCETIVVKVRIRIKEQLDPVAGLDVLKLLDLKKMKKKIGAGLHKKGQTVENCLQNVQHTPAL
jgi:hypothetical protein